MLLRFNYFSSNIGFNYLLNKTKYQTQMKSLINNSLTEFIPTNEVENKCFLFFW